MYTLGRKKESTEEELKYESLSGRSVERRSSHLSAAECYTEANVSAHLTGKKKQEEEVANLLLVRYSSSYVFLQQTLLYIYIV